MTRLGIVSGLGGELGSGLRDALARVDRILVAGGLGHPAVLAELATLAPVTAVVGHHDFIAFEGYPELAGLEAGGARILLVELLGAPERPVAPVARLLERDPPDVVVYGLDQQPRAEWIGGVFFFCPGRATPARPGAGGTCGVLHVEGPGRVTAHVLALR